MPPGMIETVIVVGITAALALGYWRGYVCGRASGFSDGIVAALDTRNEIEAFRLTRRNEDIDDLK